MGELNIALNTIVYILIFIFPGLLFRKFLFIRAHSKQFNQGNLFERFLWTLFTSISILMFSGLIFLVSRKYLEIPILDSISYKTINYLFVTISNNHLPDESKIKSTYKDFIYLLSAIYLFSSILGIICHYLFNSDIIKKVGFFKFNNYWQDLIKGAYKVSINDDAIYSYTLADILTETNEGNKLYTGIVNDYFLNPNTGELEVIILRDVKRYKKIKSKRTGLERTILVNIPGDNFCIEKNRILNMNFSYISELKSNRPFYKGLSIFFNILLIISLISLGVLMFVNNDVVYLNRWYRKVTFFICSSVFLLIFKEYFENFIRGQFKSKFKIEDLNLFLTFSIPYLWIFNFISWYMVIIIQFVSILLLSLFINKDTKK